MSTTIPITPLEQRQLDLILRRLDQVDTVVAGISRATASLPAADRIRVKRRLDTLGAAKADPWVVELRDR